ncbi:hypothetical protein SAE02_45780 [Skermanella aerolata]|uniref:BrnA antitoxin family protein n=1 Tax=Skermanella aerolata TaxID=393310 RepID=A0A512DW12_9PROT|nr:BrnA antitoxin family protein [Skermanella aerolata]KJB94883.1 hypothetical protein N826_08250 [Skermanella aerolata KACC 11604]GEO40430.1 hypothetical protein SAE02_45780 [Skermanella aerolata]
MAKKDDIVRYTAEEIDAMIAAGESRTDWSRNDTYEEIEAQIASDPDLAVPDNREELARPGFPFPLPSRANKRQVTVRYDAEVIDFFKSQGSGWQSRMNTVLRAFVESQQNGGKSR